VAQDGDNPYRKGTASVRQKPFPRNFATRPDGPPRVIPRKCCFKTPREVTNMVIPAFIYCGAGTK